MTTQRIDKPASPSFSDIEIVEGPAQPQGGPQPAIPPHRARRLNPLVKTIPDGIKIPTRPGPARSHGVLGPEQRTVSVFDKKTAKLVSVKRKEASAIRPAPHISTRFDVMNINSRPSTSQLNVTAPTNLLASAGHDDLPDYEDDMDEVTMTGIRCANETVDSEPRQTARPNDSSPMPTQLSLYSGIVERDPNMDISDWPQLGIDDDDLYAPHDFTLPTSHTDPLPPIVAPSNDNLKRQARGTFSNTYYAKLRLDAMATPQNREDWDFVKKDLEKKKLIMVAFIPDTLDALIVFSSVNKAFGSCINAHKHLLGWKDSVVVARITTATGSIPYEKHIRGNI
ncbi:hypothetical protein BU17DRAFT_68258 [Hysterangium stoloniferum]|nr:hypothetical protein BU17DRAFT_68258 [Hysterangium stoloniferum]